MIRRRLLIFRITILAAGAGLTVAGILLGELPEIMEKAVIVCLECIGIG